MENIQWVSPIDMFGNWADLSKEEKIAMEEMQYKQQMFRGVNLL